MNVTAALGTISLFERAHDFVTCHPPGDKPVSWEVEDDKTEEERPDECAHFLAAGSSPSDSVECALRASFSSLQKKLLQGHFLHEPSASAHGCANAELKSYVKALVDNAQPIGAKDLPGMLISPQHYYPLWCVLLCATAGAAHGTSFDATGAEDPKAGLYSLPLLGALLGQAGDTKITFDGAREALAGKEQALEDCRVYLTAVAGRQVLAKLKEALLKEPSPNPDDLASIEEAETTLQGLAEARKATFLSSLNQEFLAPRCKLAWWRDVVFGSASIAKLVPTTTVSILSAGGPLVGAAKDLATTLPHFSSAIGIVTGILHILQAVFEGKDARSMRKAMLQAELSDKHLFLQLFEKDRSVDNMVCQDLLDLLEHRSRERGLKTLGVDLLEAHSWVRGIYGGTTLGGTLATTILTALGGAALIGAAGMSGLGLVGVALAGAYMLWFGIRANIGMAAQKAHDKADRTAAAVHDRKTESMPGLSTAHQGRPVRAIASSLVARLKDETSREDACRVLTAMDIPSTVIDQAIGGNDSSLIELIVQWAAQVTFGSEKEALRRFYARSDVAAADKLTVLEQWVAQGNKPEDIVLKPEEAPSWAQYLGRGASMGDLRASSLTLARIQRHWDDAGFQSALNRMFQHKDARAFRNPMASTASKQEKQQGASQVLDILRAEKRHEAKVRATVEGWIRDGLWSNMQLCLGEDPATSEHRRLLVKAYGISTKEGERNIPNILATLQKHVLQPAHLLQTGTLPSFMAICKSSHGEVKQALAAKVQEFVADTVKSMADTVEATEVYTALGLTPEGRIGEHNVDAVLPVLQKLLSVSEKLRAQTLAKVVASLHTYPTGGFPPALCRLAALRELRLRCEKTDGSPLDPQDLQRALSLIKPLLKQKLHTRTLGAGQGGGVFGFFGYTLNGTGKFIEYVVQTCQGGQPAPLVLHRAELRPLFEASAEPAYRDALMRVMNQPNGAAFNDATQFAECYALQYKPGALEKALKSRNPEAARHALATQLEIARLRAEATFKGVDTAGSVAALKAYFDLEVLATRHQLTTPPLALGIDDKLLQFYRAALTWPNKTALAKNIRAMQTELEQRMSGQTGAANPFWSAKFLQSQGPAIDNDEWRKMRRLHPEILAKSHTYKAQVQTLRAWNRMSAATLWQATQKKASKVGLWLQLQFKAWGLPPLNDATLEAAITQLKEAKTAHEWTVQLAKIKSEARNKHETDLITRMVRPPTPAVRRPIEGSNSSTNDTSNNGPHKWRSGVLVPQLMN